MKESFREIIIADFYRYGLHLDLRTFIYAYIVHPGFRVTFWYRLTRYMKKKKSLILFSKLATLWLLRQQLKTGITINPGTDIGPGLYIPHPGCIVINPKCKIGKNVYISHDVLLGKAHSGPRQGEPVIGNNVFIGAGARVLGKLSIGDNAAIGVNSVVLSDIPKNTFAAGVPARVVRDIGTDEILGQVSKFYY